MLCLQEMDDQLVQSRKISDTQCLMRVTWFLSSQIRHPTDILTEIWGNVFFVRPQRKTCVWLSEMQFASRNGSCGSADFILCNSISWCVLFWAKFIFCIAIHSDLLRGGGSCWKMGSAGGDALVTGSLQGSSAALLSAASSETVTVSYSLNITKCQ